MNFSFGWIVAKVFVRGLEFEQIYTNFREERDDPERDHYQVAFRSNQGKISLWLKHLPSGEEMLVKVF